jgi:hypothetical protein
MLAGDRGDADGRFGAAHFLGGSDMSTQPDLVEAYRAANAPQAHMVANFLQGAGIPAFVDGADMSGGVGGLAVGWATAPRVLVPENELAHARSLIEAAEEIDDEPLPDSDTEVE